MAKKQLEIRELSKLEEQLMEIVWQNDEVSAQRVREIMKPTQQLAKNTVRTLLERMEKKGWLKHRVEGRAFLYSATQPKQASNGRRAVEFMEQIFGGSPEQLVAALIDHRGLSAGELTRIKSLLEQAKAKRDSSKGKS